MHPVFNDEDGVTEMIWNADFRSEGQTIRGHCAGMYFRSRGGGKRIPVGLVGRRAIGARADHQLALSRYSGFIRNLRQAERGYGWFGNIELGKIRIGEL